MHAQFQYQSTKNLAVTLKTPGIAADFAKFGLSG
jgi:hypothetical protein